MAPTSVGADADVIQIPEREMDTILDNIGLPYSTINLMHATSGLIGAGDVPLFPRSVCE
jgi:hypothetical protein